MPIIDRVLKHEFRRIPLAKKWRQHFTRLEAQSIGLTGISRGIETVDEGKMPPGRSVESWLEVYLANRVASVLADAIEKKHREAKRTIEFNEDVQITPAVGKAEEPIEFTPEDIRPALDKIYQWHKARAIEGHEAVILALRTAMKHKLKYIGKHFQISESRVCQIEAQAKRKLQEHLKEAQ
jgi:hypothetical protein